MKILAIRGHNLASLAGKFEVDFQQEPLASAGIFAISGPTGAGKSTLLDALCLALYDATPRLHTAGSRGIGLPDVGDETITPHDTRNLLRRGTAQGFAEVDFTGNDGIQYRARWSVRRAHEKTRGALQKVDMTLHTLSPLQAIGGTNQEVKKEIEQRIGLSFEQFTRAVLLAQNEFSAFLKADANERGELLETLTGSTIYSEISQRAHKRLGQENAALAALNGRLADQKPLSPEVRAQLDAECLAAATYLQQLVQRESELKQNLQWHQTWETLQQSEQAAQRAWAQHIKDQDDAAGRLAAFTQIDAIQDARPLQTKIDELTQAIATLNQRRQEGESALAKAEDAKRQADQAVQHASQALARAEQEQVTGQVPLNDAKALDARLDAMALPHQQAHQHQDTTRIEADSAQQKVTTKAQECTKAKSERDELARWLAQNSHLHALAEKWPQWDLLLTQAATAQQSAHKLANDLASARVKEGLTQAASDTAQGKLQEAATRLQTAQGQRDTANAAVKQFHPSALQSQKEAQEIRRDLLVSAQHLWDKLTTDASRQQQLQEQSNQTTQTIEAAVSALQLAQQDQGKLNGALTQSERSLKAAEAACGESVETLRANLVADEHCPVCGALDHPYRTTDPQLQAALQRLQAEVVNCRKDVQENLQHQATQSALLESHRQHMERLEQERRTLDESLHTTREQWNHHALVIATDAAPSALATCAPADRMAWFSAESALTQVALQEVSQQERAWHLANEAQAKAQAALDTCTEQHKHATAAVTAAAAAHAAISAQRLALETNQDSEAENVDALLDELATPLQSHPVNTGSDWKSLWRSNPGGFHAERQDEVKQWQSQVELRNTNALRMTTLDLEQKALLEASKLAHTAADAADRALSASATALKNMQVQRQGLFNGRAVKDVEIEFSNAITMAKAHWQGQTDAAKTHADARTRHTEALLQITTNLSEQQQNAASAQQKRHDWLEKFNTTQGSSSLGAGHPAGTGLDADQLRDLLAYSSAWLNSERTALQALATAARSAAVIVAERQNQLQLHQSSRPQMAEKSPASTLPDGTSTEDGTAPAVMENAIDAIQVALTTLQADLVPATDNATALQLSIRQDDARRIQSASLIAALEQQQARQHRWATMNDLIGSADGKKFRNYAQQFTLDVLLGYANRHLQDLSRRYHLQRIPNTLALMVLDQDMGDEMRSVHSLSGGESFLVSLALALALASLSSNRVRVESLFIDEGFGSLDADTLRVAMDALDGLQAMGRKVGVISHVQEMTERINAKILVRRTTGGKSQLSISG